MTTLTFDEAEIFSIMAEEKVPKAQATAVVRTLHKVRVDDRQLSTKQDITDLDARLTNAILRAQITTIIAVAGIMGVHFAGIAVLFAIVG